MSFKDIKTKTQSERGFTIVELLIVIVVIGILAAITIVSFNGVTARANTTSAKAAASTVAKKAEAYNAEKAAYPTTFSQLTGGGANDSFTVTGIVTLAAVPGTTGPTNSSSVLFYACGAGAGVKVGYYNYASNSAVVPATTGDNVVFSAGVTTGTCTLSTT